MKTLQILAICFLAIGCTEKEKTYAEILQLERDEINAKFANPEETILPEEELAIFEQLEFFDIDESFRVEAEFVRTEGMPVFEMRTTTDRKPLYTTYGRARFTINNQKFSLSIYQNQEHLNSEEYADYLFLPFTDLTNSITSYGGGRYLDLKKPAEGETTIILDFNRSYNPYCTYNKKYSCPIPPYENNLLTQINAGVMRFK